MTCREVIEALAEHLDEEETAGLRAELQAHLAECGACRVIYDTARRTLKIVTDSRSFDLPSGLSERLLQRTMDRLRNRTSD